MLVEPGHQEKQVVVFILDFGLKGKFYVQGKKKSPVFGTNTDS